MLKSDIIFPIAVKQYAKNKHDKGNKNIPPSISWEFDGVKSPNPTVVIIVKTKYNEYMYYTDHSSIKKINIA